MKNITNIDNNENGQIMNMPVGYIIFFIGMTVVMLWMIKKGVEKMKRTRERKPEDERVTQDSERSNAGSSYFSVPAVLSDFSSGISQFPPFSYCTQYLAERRLARTIKANLRIIRDTRKRLHEMRDEKLLAINQWDLLLAQAHGAKEKLNIIIERLSVVGERPRLIRRHEDSSISYLASQFFSVVDSEKESLLQVKRGKIRSIVSTINAIEGQHGEQHSLEMSIASEMMTQLSEALHEAQKIIEEHQHLLPSEKVTCVQK